MSHRDRGFAASRFSNASRYFRCLLIGNPQFWPFCLGNVGLVVARCNPTLMKGGTNNGHYRLFWLRSETKHEADVMALKLFCLLSFLLVGLITAGVL